MWVQSFSDDQLLRNYIDGDMKSLDKLVVKYKPKIFGFVYSKVSDKHIAEDIFQETFVKVIRTLKKGSYSEEGRFLPWVMRIAHNLIIDYYRKSSQISKFSRTDDFDIFTVLGDDSCNAENKIIRTELYDQITGIVKELPKEQREVLVMRIYNKLSFKEISENTGVSINTVLGRMRYALINVRKSVAKREIVLTV